MAHLLHIDASATPGSTSRDVAATFRRAWQDKHPGGIVTYRDLVADPPPHLTPAAISAGFVAPEERTPEQAAAVALRDKLVGELHAADAYLFSVPMYNWGIASSFKAWIDQVVVPGRTTAAVGDGPLAGRPATLITSRGGGYGPGTPKEGWDFVDPYLEKLFGEAFGFDLRLISVELTLARTVPTMEPLIPAADASRESAHTAAAHSAHTILEKLAA
jgi:FMN-dependent NADH-azoreductase